MRPPNPPPARDLPVTTLRAQLHAAAAFTRVLSAVTRARRAEQAAASDRRRAKISAFAVRTARARFEYDAAQTALQFAAESQRRNAGHSLDRRARINRAVASLFGPALTGAPASPNLPAGDAPPSP